MNETVIKERFEQVFSSNGLNRPNEDIQKLFFNKYKEYSDQTPFNIVEFISSFSINIFSSKAFSKTESGKIEYDSVSGFFSIYINESHPINRNIFTLAHELGHFICDQDYLKENKCILEDETTIRTLHRSTSVDNIDLRNREVRANKFAAEILIPYEKFIEKWSSGEPPEKIAKFFKVSEEAVKIRASNILGVILG